MTGIKEFLKTLYVCDVQHIHKYGCLREAEKEISSASELQIFFF